MNKVVLITGASKGIGASTAVAFAKQGYDVVINYQHDVAAAKKVADNITSLGQKATLIQADVFSKEGVAHLFNEYNKHYSELHVLVNNAGNPSEPSFGDYTYDKISGSLMANIGSAILCTQEATKVMRNGSVLFTSSIYGLSFGGNPGLALYSASKAAMINFAQTMAENLGPDIRCNVVAPGTTKTPAWDNVSKEYSDGSLSMNIQKEWVDPDEIAAAFIFLAETPHITAQTITVDAGWQKKIRARRVSH